MRGIATTLQQTLTAEAAGVLKRAMADAQRRGHNQVTPLHVASSLLNSTSGMLQQACLQSHRHMQHPLQCRALELCFNVALDRLPTAGAAAAPAAAATATAPLSNALVAALKRAQAHQRRGCPEQQQVPLLAVKVEMEQLVISILDDPSVSRVMREAGFSSTNAKSSLEAAAAAAATIAAAAPPLPPARIAFFGGTTARSAATASAAAAARDAEGVLAVMALSRRKNNPVLIGDEFATDCVLKEVWRRLEQHLRGVRIVNLDRGQALASIEQILEQNAAGVVVFLGNLSWCLEGKQAQQLMADLERLMQQSSSKCCRLWYLGVATSQTYTRFLAHFPSMEASLGLQPLPISPSATSCSIRPRFPNAENSKEDAAPIQGRLLPKMPFKLLEEARLPPPAAPPDDLSCCSDCNAKFEQESQQQQQQQQELAMSESVQSSSDESLPFWMKDRKQQPSSTQQLKPQSPEQVLESRKKWSKICHALHSSSRKSCSASLPNLLNDSTSSSSQTSSAEGRAEQKGFELAKPSSTWLSLSTAAAEDVSRQEEAVTGGFSLGSKSVVTELSLGTASPDASMRVHHERVRDTSGCTVQKHSLAAEDEMSIFKRLYAGLSDAVPWQLEAASKVASTITRCRLGERRIRGGTSVKSDTWMVFSGADRMGKRSIARELARLVFGSDDKFALLSLSGRRHRAGNEALLDRTPCRGRTVVHRLAELLSRTKSLCVVLLEDLDEADPGVKRALLRSVESGKLADSSGRDVSLGNAVLVLSGSTSSSSSSSASSRSLEDRFLELEPCDVKVQCVVPQVHDRSRNLDISVVEYRPAGEVLELEKQQPSVVGDKRKSRWRQAVSKVLHQRSSKAVTLDLNLGLSSHELKGTGAATFEGLDLSLVDEVVEFEEFDFDAAAENAMEKLEAVASELGVGLELDVRCLEAMVAAAWEDKHSLAAWLQQEPVASALSRCTIGSVLQLRRSDVPSSGTSFLGQVHF